MSKLREAALAALKELDYIEQTGDISTGSHIDVAQKLREALAEPEPAPESEYWGERDSVSLYVRDDEYEYSLWGDVELWGVVAGAPGGRWAGKQLNPYEIWPVGTALYVRVGAKKGEG